MYPEINYKFKIITCMLLVQESVKKRFAFRCQHRKGNKNDGLKYALLSTAATCKQKLRT